MTDNRLDARSNQPPKLTAAQAARAQMRQRVRRYKRNLAATALLGFGLLGIVIAHPDFSALLGGSSQTTQTNQSTQNTFFNQQGSNNNGSTTSPQPAATTTRTS